jgi:hypothetical protein
LRRAVCLKENEEKNKPWQRSALSAAELLNWEQVGCLLKMTARFFDFAAQNAEKTNSTCNENQFMSNGQSTIALTGSMPQKLPHE